MADIAVKIRIELNNIPARVEALTAYLAICEEDDPIARLASSFGSIDLDHAVRMTSARCGDEWVIFAQPIGNFEKLLHAYEAVPGVAA